MKRLRQLVFVGYGTRDERAAQGELWRSAEHPPPHQSIQQSADQQMHVKKLLKVEEETIKKDYRK